MQGYRREAGLKEAPSKCASRWTKTEYKAPASVDTMRRTGRPASAASCMRERTIVLPPPHRHPPATKIELRSSDEIFERGVNCCKLHPRANAHAVRSGRRLAGCGMQSWGMPRWTAIVRWSALKSAERGGIKYADRIDLAYPMCVFAENPSTPADDIMVSIAVTGTENFRS